MRISGLALVLLALGHLFIVHILFNVETINYAFVADRWTKPGSGFFWRLWDLAMVVLAVIHGLNGLRQILDEYIVSPGRRVVVHTLIWTVATVLVGMGSYAILMFEKDQGYIKTHPRKGQSQTVTASVVPGGR
jgi:succinate dehydrogenase / fumarate reductase membrane anchor subunit